MSEHLLNDPIVEMYIFETSQNLVHLEAVILTCESSGQYSLHAINEVFRVMHTIKGASAMMLVNNIAEVAHHLEDLFHHLREKGTNGLNITSLSDLLLSGLDFIKLELYKYKTGEQPSCDGGNLIARIKEFDPSREQSSALKGKGQQYYISRSMQESAKGRLYKAKVWFEPDCQMVNIRAYMLVHNLKDLTDCLHYIPSDIIENDLSAETICQEGFSLYARVEMDYQEMHQFISEAMYVTEVELTELGDETELQQFKVAASSLEEVKTPGPPADKTHISHNVVSVSVSKLDKLMDLVGEIVTAEAMVIRHPDIAGLNLDGFNKAARQLRKITTELKDTVMTIRMMPLATTFHKMHRLVRDMSKRLHKEVRLQLVGEETEVDRNIIEHIGDPLMHLIRNAVDHGIETPAERVASGKSATGTVTLEARNIGGDVLITVSDDGTGLNKDKILRRARERGLLSNTELELRDRDIFRLIFLPGFSTKESVSEFSGRGVGLDAVTKGLESIGGEVFVNSNERLGTAVTLRIPLTLAIIDGMNVRVGQATYTLPITAVRKSFRCRQEDLAIDPDGNEMVLVRGVCYPVVRLHRRFSVPTSVTELGDGILVMVEDEGKALCLFADHLVGQQQVVVKPLPSYIKRMKEIKGVMGCTILGDGVISLILGVSGLIA